MARFRMATAATTPEHQKLKIGDTIADLQANAIGKDVVWKGLSSASVSPGMIPLDGPATAMLAASRFPGGFKGFSDGVNSIQG